MSIQRKGLLQRPGATAIGIAILGGLAALIAVWPDWTLRYIHALAWPAVALIAVATLGPALARRVPALSALHLPGGVVATFEEQQETLELHGDYAAELTSPEAWGPPFDEEEAGLIEPGEPHVDQAAIATEALRVFGTIIGAFQIQIDFLRALETAEDGLSHAAARQWFSDLITTKGLDPAQWDADALLTWLVNQGAITLGQDGAYRLTSFGERILVALGLPGLYVAPKLI
jgi:hypothetical protein